MQDNDNRPELLMLQGLPASGKTTYAKKLVSQGGWVRVNKDDLRAMLDNSKHSKDNEARILRVRNTIIIDAIANGNNVVVDDTNFSSKHFKALSGIAEQLDARFHVTLIDTPLDECLRRNSERANPVPEWVIRHMADKYLKPKEVEKEEAIIVDIDGTLSHINEDNPRNPYDASRAMEDTLDDAVSVITGMAYKHGYKVIILTGRHSGHLDVTKEWLKENGVEYDEIYSRQEGDIRKDYIVKEELYRTHVEPRFKVKFVLDDRQSVVDMWRRIGLKCLQVQLGDF